jgi:hypothetical protein
MKKVLNGEYAGRPVFVSDEEVEFLDVRDSVVFLWSEEGGVAREHIETLVRHGAIAIWVGGSLSNQSFDLLLQLLSRFETGTHVMSGVVDATSATEALDSFLATAMPDPGKLDDWKAYDVIVLGSSTLSALLASHIRSTYPIT